MVLIFTDTTVQRSVISPYSKSLSKTLNSLRMSASFSLLPQSAHLEGPIEPGSLARFPS